MHIAHTVYELVRRHPFYVAGRFEGGLEALADFLGCDDVTACRVALCRAPRTGEDLNAWAARIAKRFRLDWPRVRALAERLTKG